VWLAERFFKQIKPLLAAEFPTRFSVFVSALDFLQTFTVKYCYMIILSKTEVLHKTTLKQKIFDRNLPWHKQSTIQSFETCNFHLMEK